MLPVAVHVPVAGSNSSALVRSGLLHSSSHQHLTRGQQRRRVLLACRDHAARRSPRPTRRIIQLRAVEGLQLLPPAAPCLRAATWPCENHVRCLTAGSVHVPLAGSYSSALVKAPSSFLLPPPAPCLRAAASQYEGPFRGHAASRRPRPVAGS